MAAFVHVCHIWLFWLAFFAYGTQAEGWDDFSNNLATDLSPLIALFGEQVTKQFLSESLSPLDNFIFAMAPLGILTAVVSAIRVCGSSSLRAFIGRAQEGDGVVEAELCSSTSRSVSELYNNGGFARVFGRPKILEVVRDPTSDEFYDIGERGLTAGIFKFGDYQSTGKGREEWIEVGNGIRNLFGRRMKKTGRDQKTGPVEDQLQPHNPNLSLNIGIKRQPDWVFWTAAVIGFVVQTAVLVFGALITYQLHWEKDGRRPGRWAFPLSFSGTLLQCSGMFLCARLVEKSTEERKFHRKLHRPGPRIRSSSTLHWLQPGNQAVGDQVFDAFAYSDSTKPLHDYVTSSKVKAPKPIFLVWVAISVTMSGFLLQFVGLRSMHSSVAVFQLGAMLLMSAIRASLRARRIDENDLRDMLDIVQGHELDWQALKFEAISSEKGSKERFWLVRNGPTETQNDSKAEGGVVFIDRLHGSKSHSVIGFKSVSNEEEVRFISEAQKHEQQRTPTEQRVEWRPVRPCLAVRFLKYRARLARLTSAGPSISHLSIWGDKQVYVRDCARRLRMVIEEAAEILFSDASHLTEEWIGVSSLYWSLDVVSELENSDQSKPDSVLISVRRKTGSNRWQADISELEAVLGLWTWSWKKAYQKYRSSGENCHRRVLAEGMGEDAIESTKVDLAIWMESFKKGCKGKSSKSKKVPLHCSVRNQCWQGSSMFLQYLRTIA
jgi:hypothetical protein